MKPTRTAAVSYLTFSKRVGLVRFFLLLFNSFAFLFAAIMTLDVMEFRLGIPTATFYTMAGGCVLLAGLSFLAHLLVKPENYQDCPNCREKILFFLRWHCNSCNTDQKRPLYVVEKCIKCKASLGVLPCPHCGATIDLDSL